MSLKQCPNIEPSKGSYSKMVKGNDDWFKSSTTTTTTASPAAVIAEIGFVY